MLIVSHTRPLSLTECLTWCRREPSCQAEWHFASCNTVRPRPSADMLDGSRLISASYRLGSSLRHEIVDHDLPASWDGQ